MTGGKWPDGDTGGACAVGIGVASNVHGNQAAGSAKTAERLCSKALK
jgi:hypothetical protein